MKQTRKTRLEEDEWRVVLSVMETTAHKLLSVFLLWGFPWVRWAKGVPEFLQRQLFCREMSLELWHLNWFLQNTFGGGSLEEGRRARMRNWKRGRDAEGPRGRRRGSLGPEGWVGLRSVRGEHVRGAQIGTGVYQRQMPQRFSQALKKHLHFYKIMLAGEAVGGRDIMNE